jgi:glycosyltransferase involved in cell wall biosynthesis
VRILHVGWGFWPWRVGGLIRYAEDLMAAQMARGDAAAMFEVINGPIVSGLELGTRRPGLDLDEPVTEASFRSVLDSFRPDVVHFQELLCLPSSLIDLAAHAGVPTVMTLQDYGPLCSTLRLFDAGGGLCTRLDVGEDCARRNAAAPATRRAFVEDTLRFEIPRWRRRFRAHRWPRRYDRLAERVSEWSLRRVDAEPRPREDPTPAAFQRRRDVNVERLGRVGRLVAQSPRVAEIYRERGVSPARMSTFPFTLAHIEHLEPRPMRAPPDPIAFATLGGCAARTKGAHLIVEALAALRAAGLEGRFRLLVFGGVGEDVRPALEADPNVELRGTYAPAELDGLLDEVDVGIMPSIWEEAFAYTGLEMIAKGIPLIANPLGGMVEYAREGETAWLNRPCSGQGLAELMTTLIADSRQVLEMHERVLAGRERLLPTMDAHVREIYGAYGAAADSRLVFDGLP